MASHLVLKLTEGIDSPEKVSQAFTVLASAAASAYSVSLWLTGDAVWFGTPGKLEELELADAPNVAELRDSILAVGRITVCSQCAARRKIGSQDVIPRVRIAGAASFVEEVMSPDTQALVY